MMILIRLDLFDLPRAQQPVELGEERPGNENSHNHMLCYVMVPLLPPVNCVEHSWGWRLHATSAQLAARLTSDHSNENSHTHSNENSHNHSQGYVMLRRFGEEQQPARLHVQAMGACESYMYLSHMVIYTYIL
jgi:hypothetical protein